MNFIEEVCFSIILAHGFLDYFILPEIRDKLEYLSFVVMAMVLIYNLRPLMVYLFTLLSIYHMTNDLDYIHYNYNNIHYVTVALFAAVPLRFPWWRNFFVDYFHLKYKTADFMFYPVYATYVTSAYYIIKRDGLFFYIIYSNVFRMTYKYLDITPFHQLVFYLTFVHVPLSVTRLNTYYQENEPFSLLLASFSFVMMVLNKLDLNHITSSLFMSFTITHIAYMSAWQYHHPYNGFLPKTN